MLSPLRAHLFGHNCFSQVFGSNFLSRVSDETRTRFSFFFRDQPRLQDHTNDVSRALFACLRFRRQTFVDRTRVSGLALPVTRVHHSWQLVPHWANEYPDELVRAECESNRNDCVSKTCRSTRSLRTHFQVPAASAAHPFDDFFTIADRAEEPC